MKWCISVLAILIIILHTSPKAIAQKDTLRVPVDILYFGEYTLINYKIILDEDTNWRNFVIYRGNDTILTSMTWYPPPELYTFCYHSGGAGPICPLKDLNGDGKDEVIIILGSGGSAGNESAYIYTLDSTAINIGSFDGFDGELGPFGMEDIDCDSLMEVTMWDEHNNYWPCGNGTMGSINLVWKWDGKNYRLANYKLADQILRKLNHLNPDSLNILLIGIKKNPEKISNFNPSIEQGWPVELMELMLALVYANKTPLAEKACEYSWQKGDSTRYIFERVFWKHVKSGPHWQELQESNW
jgi:hypothetical protein